jgi:hypothetical protein
LQQWLQRNASCPLCRRQLEVALPSSLPPGNNNNNNNNTNNNNRSTIRLNPNHRRLQKMYAGIYGDHASRVLQARQHLQQGDQDQHDEQEQQQQHQEQNIPQFITISTTSPPSHPSNLHFKEEDDDWLVDDLEELLYYEQYL